MASKPQHIAYYMAWPHQLFKTLHAHNTGHWRAKFADVKQVRLTAAWDWRAMSQRVFGPTCPAWKTATLSVTFAMPDRRRRDLLNMLQSLKPVIDGAVDAGIIVDDHWEVLQLGHCDVTVDRKNPHILLTLTEGRKREDT